LKKKGEGVHHIAFEVSDIESEMERLKSEGFVVLNEKPKEGADNKLVCFLHPRHTKRRAYRIMHVHKDFAGRRMSELFHAVLLTSFLSSTCVSALMIPNFSTGSLGRQFAKHLFY
jgi:catechol 2,3-dioxygenase-like lactoylglutathione lyase family enzyme